MSWLNDAIWQIPLGPWISAAVQWLQIELDAPLTWFSDNAKLLLVDFEHALVWIPMWLLIAFFAFAAWRLRGRGLALFTLVGFWLIGSMGMWEPAMSTLALVVAASVVAIVVGVPVGIWAARSRRVSTLVRPVLDFMQTLPVFVYLLPAVFFFGLGAVPGMIATIIFAMPPTIRLTELGIRQVPGEVVEAAQAFGSTPNQMLWKVQLPMAMPTVMAGVNQNIMLSLSMVVIAGMIGAGGLGTVVITGINSLDVGLGFEGGISVVIMAIFLDRLTEAVGRSRK